MKLTAGVFQRFLETAVQYTVFNMLQNKARNWLYQVFNNMNYNVVYTSHVMMCQFTKWLYTWALLRYIAIYMYIYCNQVHLLPPLLNKQDNSEQGSHFTGRMKVVASVIHTWHIWNKTITGRHKNWWVSFTCLFYLFTLHAADAVVHGAFICIWFWFWCRQP